MAKTTEPDVAEAVRSIVLDMAPIENVEGGRELDLVTDLGYDSLTLLEVVVAVEEELGLRQLAGGPAASVTTLGDVEDYVRTSVSRSR